MCPIEKKSDLWQFQIWRLCKGYVRLRYVSLSLYLLGLALFWFQGERFCFEVSLFVLLVPQCLYSWLWFSFCLCCICVAWALLPHSGMLKCVYFEWGTWPIHNCDKMKEVSWNYGKTLLAGDFTHFYFHPDPWGNDSIWLIFFRWVVQPQTSLPPSPLPFSGAEGWEVRSLDRIDPWLNLRGFWVYKMWTIGLTDQNMLFNRGRGG